MARNCCVGLHQNIIKNCCFFLWFFCGLLFVPGSSPSDQCICRHLPLTSSMWFVQCSYCSPSSVSLCGGFPDQSLRPILLLAILRFALWGIPRPIIARHRVTQCKVTVKTYEMELATRTTNMEKAAEKGNTQFCKSK